MTYLVGAWLREPAELDQRVCPAWRRRIRSLLPDARFREYRGERLWLVGPAGHLVSEGGAVVAMEGFAAGTSVRDILSRWRAGRGAAAPSSSQTFVPPGHASVVRADEARGILCLSRGLIGGERLYYRESGSVVWFAGSLRYLLDSQLGSVSLDVECLPEAFLTGLVLDGARTLVSGVEEVRVGHTRCWRRGAGESSWHGPDLMAAPSAELAVEARRYHDKLIEAVVSAIGHTRPVALTLSGGIDSSAIAAAAVEAFGAAQVTAYTYEFDDPGHPCETPYARAVCRRLGITDHRVFKLEFRQFLEAIPHTVWRTESLSSWPKAFMVQVTRRIREDGFDRYLTGFGIGSHMQYFADLARALPMLTATGFAPWEGARPATRGWRRHFERLHPGLAFPGWRLLLPVLWLLRERGVVADLARHYPTDAKTLATRVVPASPALANELRSAPLAAIMSQMAFEGLYSCVDVTRWEKFSRELGVYRISPAHFADCLPFAYLPARPPGGISAGERALRPGKLLTRTAFAQVLPHSVLYRRKSWADAVISPRWFEAGARWLSMGAGECDPLLELTPELAQSAWKWDRRAPQAAVSAFSLWRRLLLSAPPTRDVPRWSTLPALAPKLG